MENQHKKIKGYRELAQEEVDQMNEIKSLAEQVGQLVDELEKNSDADGRSLAIAKTNLQQGFMWAVRSIAKPETF